MKSLERLKIFKKYDMHSRVFLGEQTGGMKKEISEAKLFELGEVDTLELCWLEPFELSSASVMGDATGEHEEDEDEPENSEQLMEHEIEQALIEHSPISP